MGALSDCRPLFRSVLTKTAIYGFRVGEEFVQVRIDKNDIRSFAVPLRVLAADTRSDQVLQIFVPKGISPFMDVPHSRCHLTIDDAMFGLSGFTSRVRVFGTMTRSISSIGIAPSKT